MWKYNGEILENKNGDWRYLNETWILPEPQRDIEGQEIRNYQGHVLKATLLGDMPIKFTGKNFVHFSTGIKH